MTFHFSKKLTLSFKEAVELVTAELGKEGFGIITSIDIKETFKKKLAVEFRNYMILGACKPQFAYKAILADDKAGIFLPCNVVVQEHENGEVEVSVVNPEEAMHAVDNIKLKEFATELKGSLQNMMDRL